MREDNGTVAKVFMIGDCVDDGITAVVFPVKGIGIGYSFRWKRNVEKRDGCGVLRSLYISRKQVAKTGKKLIYYRKGITGIDLEVVG